MTRRSKGEGTIYQRASDGRWCGQVTLPGGKRQTFYRKKRKEVVAKLDEVRAALARGLPIPSEKQTLGDWLTTWLAGLAKVRPSTRNRYAQDVRYIIAGLGSFSLARLSAPEIQLFYAKLLAYLSTTTVYHLHATLHHALHDAQRMKLIAENVSEYVEVAGPRHVEMQALDEAQARALREAAEGHRFEALYVVAVQVGMRRGELLALKWADVDLDRGTVSVRANVQIVDRAPLGSRLQLAETKTENSRRLIHLPPQAIDALRSHRAKQLAERLQLGALWQDRGLVFPGHLGGILNPKTPGVHLTRLLKTAGLPIIRFHDLRHTAISIALARGIPVHMVAEMAGDTERTILKVYAHVTPTMRADTAAIIGAVFGG